MKNSIQIVNQNDSRKTFNFRVILNGNEVLKNPNGFTQKTNCQKSCSSVRRNGKNQDRYEIVKSSKSYQLCLKSGNGQIIASSAFKSEKEIEELKNELVNAIHSFQIEDTTK